MKSDVISIATCYEVNPRSWEVWRQTGREREFRVSAGVSQFGGFRAKPVVIGLLCALEVGGECWSQKDWRRECPPTVKNMKT